MSRRCTAVAVGVAATLALGLACSAARAWEPPHTTIAEAIASSRVAFIGRVVRTTEVGHERFRTVGSAQFAIRRALVRCPVPEGGVLSLTYATESTADLELPVDFVLSAEYLVVLNGDDARFDTNQAGGPDLAWQSNKVTLQGEPAVFFDVTEDDVSAFARARESELRAAERK